MMNAVSASGVGSVESVESIVTEGSSGTFIVGLGKTGLSCARFLVRNGQSFSVVDSRTNPPGIEELKQDLPDVHAYLGEINDDAFTNANQLIVSPGISIREAYVQNAKNSGAEIIGDIEVFARHVNAPVVAITGSNGKSTVTSLVGEMALAAGLIAKVGGNIGIPALDLLDGTDADFYILELSSFQLETTHSLNAIAAVVLNVSEDHMDRYSSLGEYAHAKQAIYHGNGAMIVNADDPLVMAMGDAVRQGANVTSANNSSKNQPRRVITFTLHAPRDSDYGIISEGGKDYLAKGNSKLLDVKHMRMQGTHNWANALAALALGEVMALPLDSMLEVLRHFEGLPHRTQFVREFRGVTYINDSKGTNVGATISAIQGLPGRKILIAGGLGKGADFSPLAKAISDNNVFAVVLMGQDADLMARVFSGIVPVHMASDMDHAVQIASRIAQQGDLVLLSPACASFDMFNGFEHRGACFAEAVEALGR